MQIVEAGAHDGQLAKDILNWLKLRRPALFERIEYWIVEPSARRQEWQRETLDEFAPGPLVQTSVSPIVQTAHSQPGNRIGGVIFSNELLDAMPVHRLGWDAKRREWFEWGVTLTRRTTLIGRRLPRPQSTPHASTPHAASRAELLEVLPDGFTTEVCPAAEDWWREAASVLGARQTADV